MTQIGLDLDDKTWGGARDGAGRKKTGKRSDPLHRTRPALSRHCPVHVVLRVVPGAGRLRRGRTFGAVRRSLTRCLGSIDFRVVHVSIQANHLHFLVEAGHEKALWRGMQRLEILLARAINRELGRTGKLFAHRYHATQIRSPRQARNALAYVLNNWRRHREDRGSLRARSALVDPYSSGLAFTGWRGSPTFDTPLDFEALPVTAPRTWLLRVGWKQHAAIDLREVPGPIRS